MNQKTFEKLQYPELIAKVKPYCMSKLGQQYLEQLLPATDPVTVQRRLDETSNAKAILTTPQKVPALIATDVAAIVEMLTDGYILKPEELTKISIFLKDVRIIQNFMMAQQYIAPILADYAADLQPFRTIETEIERVIKNKRIEDDASKALQQTRQQIKATTQKIKERLRQFLASKQQRNYIQEFVITLKHDHYTIPIKASYKHQVAGEVIALSSKGQTAFMSPSSIQKLSDVLIDLKATESAIEYQILATLSGLVAEKIAPMTVNVQLIGQYDLIFAKAKYSQAIDGIAPKLNTQGQIRLVDCRHPLLTGTVVPLKFEIGQTYRSLMITGPNAGGKTIVLKTVGLVTLATMAGLHIAAAAGTEIAIFEQIFVDLGDNQSLENALSTFSAHMQNLSQILQTAQSKTLLLFDEIGSGTEPNEGAALAIALLEAFYQKGCTTVATTHYGEIKRFSETHPGFINAAMQFDNQTLQPKYQLLIGQAGDSNALWIARRMKIPEAIITKAAAYMTQGMTESH
ncbi:endonuclease MutS2 [Agrilactobacillus yilanensis]|uniref:Endonuclease MutS2 n=1 Tax=Agrilactobacillus yilanensis TaxID=2485997 RepID=A0ABW4J4Z0_9LACO|nr:endonuclease MutS2 [Agrilactobacillus yilanensis]